MVSRGCFANLKKNWSGSMKTISEIINSGEYIFINIRQFPATL